MNWFFFIGTIPILRYSEVLHERRKAYEEPSVVVVRGPVNLE